MPNNQPSDYMESQGTGYIVSDDTITSDDTISKEDTFEEDMNYYN